MIVVISHATAQQSGSVVGIILSKETQTGLIGATAKIKGTSLGAISKRDGSFTIKNIAVGTYTIVISSIGFESRSYSDIVIKSGRTTPLDAELIEKTSSTQEVTVRADFFSANTTTPVSTSEYSTEEIRRAPGSAGDIN
jgi:hypothetical protein